MRAPSAILVVRHGARLDAADPEWYLTTPTPYDPPLTYGGWNQAKALGARIATIVSHRAGDQARSSAIREDGRSKADGKKLVKRKQKVVIHSSPYLRCLQTSVAIGAGMAQSLEASEKRRRKSRHGKSGRKSPGNGEETTDHSLEKVAMETPDKIDVKTILRVDAFLGEWLAPDYFDHITPPPNSTLMVAAAKSNLLRKEQIEAFEPTAQAAGYFPGGWSNSDTSRRVVSAESAVAEDSAPTDRIAVSAPLRPQRSNSASCSLEHVHDARQALSSLRPMKAAYDPPTPSYAIKPTDPIPKGYCVHARDLCSDIDLLWDSMRMPQEWGTGGEIGEEWSAMHKRFRKGLSKMIDWYGRHTPEFHPDREDPLALDECEPEDDDDDEYDLTVVMVTHAAGCNALVGALTNQPVLRDFALTSLSMAVRNSDASTELTSPRKEHEKSPFGRRRSSVHMTVSDDYHLEVLSSVDHLRAGTQAANPANLPSPHLVAKIPAYASLSRVRESINDSKLRRGISTAVGSIRRPNQAALAPTQPENMPVSANPGASAGLWTRPPKASLLVQEPPLLSLGSPAQTVVTPQDYPQRPLSPERGAKEHSDKIGPLSEAMSSKSSGQRGLWGSAAKRQAFVMHKRRWTVSEKDGFD